MAGRHSTAPRRRRRPSQRRQVALVAALPVVLGGVLYSAEASLIDLGGCSESLDVSVAATQESVELLRDATGVLEADGAEADGYCVDYRVSAAAPNEVSRSLDARSEAAPTLWVPDSSAWLDRIDGFDGEAKVVAESLGRSPVIVAGRGLPRPLSWRDVLSREHVTFVDPLSSTAPAAALLALSAESRSTGASEEEVSSIMGPLAQRLGGDEDAPSDLTELALDPGGAAVLSEQQLMDLRAHGLGRDFDAQVPRTGTLALDYPLVALTEDPAEVEAAEHLSDYLTGPEGAQLLTAAGFRSADLEPLPMDRGAGEVRLLPSPKADVVAQLLRRWSVLTVPSRILGVFDVSGSMDELAGGRTRMALAVEASAGALGVFPDQSRIGVWAFSEGLGPGSRDHTELVPVRRLDARVGSQTQQRLLGEALSTLPRMTSGGTGLYDTTLAAVQAMRSDYEPGAINTLVLMTDGRNEDPGSISQAKLLRELRKLRDPRRPVTVIAVGLGPDADAEALRRIVDATGGRSYVVRQPSQLSKVFEEALLSR